MLWRDMVAREVDRQWDRMTVAPFGIGVLPPTPGMIVYIGDACTPMLISKGAVGDVSIHGFNRSGDILETLLIDCMIGVGVDQLRRTPSRIALASGIETANAVAGALRTGLVSHLVADTQLAAAALRNSDR